MNFLMRSAGFPLVNLPDVRLRVHQMQILNGMIRLGFALGLLDRMKPFEHLHVSDQMVDILL